MLTNEPHPAVITALLVFAMALALPGTDALTNSVNVMLAAISLYYMKGGN